MYIGYCMYRTFPASVHDIDGTLQTHHTTKNL